MFGLIARDTLLFPCVRGLSAALLLADLTGAAAAGHRHRGVPPSRDAVELAGIAPPGNRSTVLQTYGDAEIARAAVQRRIARKDAANGEKERTGGAPYPCDPRLATDDAYVCRNDPRPIGFGQTYVFMPSYVSAPTVFEQDLRTQAPIMPAITRFFWSANSRTPDHSRKPPVPRARTG